MVDAVMAMRSDIPIITTSKAHKVALRRYLSSTSIMWGKTKGQMSDEIAVSKPLTANGYFIDLLSCRDKSRSYKESKEEGHDNDYLDH